jgi:TPR repeat protein
VKSIPRRSRSRRAAAPLPLLACLLLNTPWVAAADLAAALSALDRGDYTTAIPELDALAGAGDPVAMTRLATLYQEGKGVSKDATRAAMLYEQAAARGHADAQYNLGNMYLLGEGVPQDDDWAFTYYREAAKQGHVMAQKNVAEFYRAAGLTPPAEEMTPPVAAAPAASAPVPLTEPNAEPATAATPPAAEEDDEATRPYVPPPAPPPAAYSQDELNAMQIARRHGIRIADAGSLPAGAPPVMVPRESAQAGGVEPVPPDVTTRRPGDLSGAKALIADGKPADAVPLLEAAAGQGDAEAQYLLSQLLTTLSNGPDDNATALSWLQRAAAGGYADAQFLLGARYERGEGVMPDEAEAVTWYRAAARQGHSEAAERLRAIYRDAGVPMPEDAAPPAGGGRTGATAPVSTQTITFAVITHSRQCPCIQHAYSSPAV